jgi:TonB family protein
MTRTRNVALLTVGMALALGASHIVTAQGQQAVAAQIIQPDQEDEFLKGTVPLKTVGLKEPKIKKQTGPKYTPEAMKLGIQGSVILEAVIGVDGRVEKVRVKEKLHPELDREAIDTLKAWQFEPARLYLEPVRVMVEVHMAFQLG